MSNLYWTQIQKWKIKYKIDPIKSYAPTQIKLCCSICGSSVKMNRHHMACDFTFAYMLEDVYARRYMEFRDEDIDWICERCHQAYHKYTKKYLNAVIRWNQYALVHVRKDYREMLELKRIEMLQRYLRWKIRRIKRLQKQD